MSRQALRVATLRMVLPLLAVAALAGCGPKVDFSADVTAGNAPLAVQFTNHSQALFLGLDVGQIFPITNYQWDFGDETGSLEVSPSHTYTVGGKMSVSLTATSLLGTSTASKAQLITVAANGPVAKFTHANDPSDVRIVNFVDTSTTGTGTIGYRQWEFGDGTFDAVVGPKHAYDAAGDFVVKLTVCTATDCDTAELTVTIPALTPPIASFAYKTPNTSNLLLVQFEDTSTAGNIPVVSQQWDFGDGSKDTAPIVQHLYAATGNYKVKLSACTDTHLCSDAEPQIVQVGVVAPTP